MALLPPALSDLPDWLLKKVKFVNLKKCVPPDELTAVYQALGVVADVVETVAGMSLMFRDGCLVVSEAWAGCDDLMEGSWMENSWRHQALLARRFTLPEDMDVLARRKL